jgi:hypothetical protein
MGTLNDCDQHAEIRSESPRAGLGPIAANRFKSGLLDIPLYRSIPIMNQELSCADGADTMTQLVPRDDGGHIAATYGEFVEDFRKDKVETLLPHRSTDHAIDLEPGYSLPYGRIYTISEFEIRT